MGLKENNFKVCKLSGTCQDEPPSSSQEESSAAACCPEEPGQEDPDEFIPEFSDGENSHSPVPPQLSSDKDFEPRNSLILIDFKSLRIKKCST